MASYVMRVATTESGYQISLVLDGLDHGTWFGSTFDVAVLQLKHLMNTLQWSQVIFESTNLCDQFADAIGTKSDRIHTILYDKDAA